MDAKGWIARAQGGRRSVAAAALLFMLAAVIGACAPLPVAAPGGAQTGPFELTVVHSSDTWGYLDPCG